MKQNYESLHEMMADLKKYKKQTRGTAVLTESEIANAAKAFKRMRMNESVRPRTNRARRVKTNDYDLFVENYKAYKRQAFNEGRVDSPKITLKEMTDLKGLFERANQRRIILREATEPLSTEMPPAQGQDATGMTPADPMSDPMGAGAEQPALSNEELQSTISSLLAQVQTLAQQIGVPTTELQGDPNAQIAPDMSAQGDPNAAIDPNAAAAEPALAESCKIWRREHPGEAMNEATFKELKHRIDEREGHLETFNERMAMRNASNSVLQSQLNESGVQDYAKAYFDFIGQSMGPATKMAPQASSGLNKETQGASVSQMQGGVIVGEPGSKKAKINWNGLKTPRQTSGNGPEMPGEKPKNAIHESVTDRYLREAAEPKLDFNQIEAMFNKGLLG